MTPTSRTLRHMRDDGWIAEVVEKWVPMARIRRDLFGCIDIVAVKAGERICGIQATSGSNVNARIKKSLAEPRLKTWLEAGGRFAVMGWAKKGPRGGRKTWQPIWKEITHADFNDARNASGASSV